MLHAGGSCMLHVRGRGLVRVGGRGMAQVGGRTRVTNWKYYYSWTFSELDMGYGMTLT